MQTGMLHSHVLLVTLFVLSYFIKTILYFSNRGAFDKYLKVMKVPEMVISFLFLATGIYLAIQLESMQPWFIAKLVGVALVIPMSIIGYKKEIKPMILLAGVLLLYIYGISETRSPTFVKAKDETIVTDTLSADYDIMEHGKALYDGRVGNVSGKACVHCHGENGDLGSEGALNLQMSELEVEQRMMIIANGTSLMPPYADQLSEQEMRAVATYLNTFTKK